MRINELVMHGEYNSLKNSLDKDKEAINEKDDLGRTPLINAVIENNESFVQLLIEYYADLNVKDNLGYTALHYASQDYLPRITEILLYKGADIEAKDTNGNTPLLRAVFTSQGREEVIKILIDHDANKYSKNNHGISPVDLANTIDNYNIKEYLK